MALSVNLNGTLYSVPENAETGYGASLSTYLKALATAFPQLGGTATLTSELDFGTSFGLKAFYLKTWSANPASAGIIRLARADSIKWRNQANAADLDLSVDSSNNLSFATNYITGNPMLGASTAAGQSIANGASEVIVVFGTVEVDTDSAYNSGTGRFTVPAGKGGHYHITAQIAYSTAPTGTCTASIYKNAAALKTTQAIAPGAQQTITIEAIAQLAAADIIDIRTKHGNAGAQLLQATAILNYVAIKRITS